MHEPAIHQLARNKGPGLICFVCVRGSLFSSIKSGGKLTFLTLS
jgi:hypothetical protein